MIFTPDVIQYLNTNHIIATMIIKKNILREIGTITYESDFLKKLDANPDLIGFNNGVYDLKMKEFRNGRPDDYISLGLGYDYVVYDCEDDAISNLLSMLPFNINMRKYFYTSKYFSDSSRDETHKLHYQYISESSEDENDDDKININYVKQLTGDDKMAVRELFAEPTNFKAQFRPFILCNSLPQIDSDYIGKYSQPDGPVKKDDAPEIDQKFIDACELGKYYKPAYMHYEQMINVYCDMCQEEQLCECFGYQDIDLCLQCMQQITGMPGLEGRSDEDDMPGLGGGSDEDDMPELVGGSDDTSESDEEYEIVITANEQRIVNKIKEMIKIGADRSTNTRVTIIQDNKIKNNGHDLPKLIDAHGKIMIENNAELAVMLFEETDSVPEIERIYINRFHVINAYVDNVDTALTFEYGIYIEVPINKKDISKVRCHMLVKHNTMQLVLDLHKFYDLYA